MPKPGTVGPRPGLRSNRPSQPPPPNAKQPKSSSSPIGAAGAGGSKPSAAAAPPVSPRRVSVSAAGRPPPPASPRGSPKKQEPSSPTPPKAEDSAPAAVSAPKSKPAQLPPIDTSKEEDVDTADEGGGSVPQTPPKPRSIHLPTDDNEDDTSTAMAGPDKSTNVKATPPPKSSAKQRTPPPSTSVRTRPPSMAPVLEEEGATDSESEADLAGRPAQHSASSAFSATKPKQGGGKTAPGPPPQSAKQPDAPPKAPPAPPAGDKPPLAPGPAVESKELPSAAESPKTTAGSDSPTPDTDDIGSESPLKRRVSWTERMRLDQSAMQDSSTPPDVSAREATGEDAPKAPLTPDSVRRKRDKKSKKEKKLKKKKSKKHLDEQEDEGSVFSFPDEGDEGGSPRRRNKGGRGDYGEYDDAEAEYPHSPRRWAARSLSHADLSDGELADLHAHEVAMARQGLDIYGEPLEPDHDAALHVLDHVSQTGGSVVPGGPLSVGPPGEPVDKGTAMLQLMQMQMQMMMQLSGMQPQMMGQSAVVPPQPSTHPSQSAAWQAHTAGRAGAPAPSIAHGRMQDAGRSAQRRRKPADVPKAPTPPPEVGRVSTASEPSRSPPPDPASDGGGKKKWKPPAPAQGAPPVDFRPHASRTKQEPMKAGPFFAGAVADSSASNADEKVSPPAPHQEQALASTSSDNALSARRGSSSSTLGSNASHAAPLEPLADNAPKTLEADEAYQGVAQSLANVSAMQEAMQQRMAASAAGKAAPAMPRVIQTPPSTPGGAPGYMVVDPNGLSPAAAARIAQLAKDKADGKLGTTPAGWSAEGPPRPPIAVPPAPPSAMASPPSQGPSSAESVPLSPLVRVASAAALKDDEKAATRHPVAASRPTPPSTLNRGPPSAVEQARARAKAQAKQLASDAQAVAAAKASAAAAVATPPMAPTKPVPADGAPPLTGVRKSGAAPPPMLVRPAAAASASAGVPAAPVSQPKGKQQRPPRASPAPVPGGSAPVTREVLPERGSAPPLPPGMSVKAGVVEPAPRAEPVTARGPSSAPASHASPGPKLGAPSAQTGSKLVRTPTSSARSVVPPPQPVAAGGTSKPKPMVAGSTDSVISMVVKSDGQRQRPAPSTAPRTGSVKAPTVPVTPTPPKLPKGPPVSLVQAIARAAGALGVQNAMVGCSEAVSDVQNTARVLAATSTALATTALQRIDAATTLCTDASKAKQSMQRMADAHATHLQKIAEAHFRPGSHLHRLQGQVLSTQADTERLKARAAELARQARRTQQAMLHTSSAETAVAASKVRGATAATAAGMAGVEQEVLMSTLESALRSLRATVQEIHAARDQQRRAALQLAASASSEQQREDAEQVEELHDRVQAAEAGVRHLELEQYSTRIAASRNALQALDAGDLMSTIARHGRAQEASGSPVDTHPQLLAELPPVSAEAARAVEMALGHIVRGVYEGHQGLLSGSSVGVGGEHSDDEGSASVFTGSSRTSVGAESWASGSAVSERHVDSMVHAILYGSQPGRVGGAVVQESKAEQHDALDVHEQDSFQGENSDSWSSSGSSNSHGNSSRGQGGVEAMLAAHWHTEAMAKVAADGIASACSTSLWQQVLAPSPVAGKAAPAPVAAPVAAPEAVPGATALALPPAPWQPVGAHTSASVARETARGSRPVPGQLQHTKGRFSATRQASAHRLAAAAAGTDALTAVGQSHMTALDKELQRRIRQQFQ